MKKYHRNLPLKDSGTLRSVIGEGFSKMYDSHLLPITKLNPHHALQRSESLLSEMLPEPLASCIPYVRPYLLGSFGSFGRIDYGLGHELCFALFLLCLSLLRFFQPTPEEEAIVCLKVFDRYMHVVWKLQDVYKLEPAGSHGVWGLDDFHFLPYLWGSAQLRSM